eukprot:356499-Chlamydomonas_euryale.AAC.4
MRTLSHTQQLGLSTPATALLLPTCVPGLVRAPLDPSSFGGWCWWDVCVGGGAAAAAKGPQAAVRPDVPNNLAA